MHPSFFIGESLRFGWEKFKSHSALLLQAMLVIFALEIVNAVVRATLAHTLMGAAASIVIVVLELFVGAGLTLISLRVAQGEHTSLRDLFPHWLMVLKFYCANILAGIIIVIPLLVGFAIAFVLGIGSLFIGEGSPSMAAATTGLIIAVIVAILAVICAGYFALRYSLVRYAIFDGVSITESLRTSALLTQGVKWRLLGFVIVLILLNLIGMALLLVGLLVSIPVTTLAYAHIYLKLKAHAS